MPRTLAPAPLDSASYWRRLLAAVHPDRNGGDGDLFIFATALEEHVRGCLAGYGRDAPYGSPFADANRGGAGEAGTSPTEPDRVAFDPALGNADQFVELTCHALQVGRDVGEPYGAVLGLLIDCAAHDHGRAVPRQSRGASYRQLAKIAHTCGWSKDERVAFYRLAESVPLSDHHCAHLLGRLVPKQDAA